MRLNRWDRLGVAVSAALSLLFLLVSFICAVAPDLFQAVAGALRNGLFLRILLMTACIALAVFICGCVWPLLRGGQEVAQEEKTVPLDDGEGGSVRVSQAALEALVRRAVGSIKGVEKYDVKLFQSAGSLNVTLEASVRQGVKLPDLAQAAQSSVRQTLEEMAGVKVDAVALLVTDILPDAAQASSGQGKG
ncbi:MAG: alkaline shock response membrane anchor protein AmaP [Clostridia bacterium]|nr:alkaline shock response membrane anchor protein AmaP [Clostridia bacterium]